MVHRCRLSFRAWCLLTSRSINFTHAKKLHTRKKKKATVLKKNQSCSPLEPIITSPIFVLVGICTIEHRSVLQTYHKQEQNVEHMWQTDESSVRRTRNDSNTRHMSARCADSVHNSVHCYFSAGPAPVPSFLRSAAASGAVRPESSSAAPAT